MRIEIRLHGHVMLNMDSEMLLHAMILAGHDLPLLITPGLVLETVCRTDDGTKEIFDAKTVAEQNNDEDFE